MEHRKLSFKDAFKSLRIRFENENQNYCEKMNSILENTKLKESGITNLNVQKSNEVETQEEVLTKFKSSSIENLNYSNSFAVNNKEVSMTLKNVKFRKNKRNGIKNNNPKLNCNIIDTLKPLTEDMGFSKHLKMPYENSCIVEKREKVEEISEDKNFAFKQEGDFHSTTIKQKSTCYLPFTFEYKSRSCVKRYNLKWPVVLKNTKDYKTPNRCETPDNKMICDLRNKSKDDSDTANRQYQIENSYISRQNCISEDATMQKLDLKKETYQDQWRDLEISEEQDQNEPEYFRKLFIGNLDEDTSEMNLMYYFDQFGTIDECVVIRNPKTRKSKCFGYVIFQHHYMLTDALETAPHEIDGRKVTLFELGNDGCAPRQFCKLFVGQLNDITTVKDLKQYFTKWGTVADCVIMRNPETRRSKSCGFVTYTHFHMMMDALAHRPHTIDGKRINLDIFTEESSEPVPVCSRTLIIKNLNLETREGTLMFYFEKFGKVNNCVIMKDPNTRISRGFGYLVFEQISTIAAIQTASPHKIDNREVSLLTPEKVNNTPERHRTLQIENLNYETEEDTLIYYFEKIGIVESCAIMREEITRRSKGFGYVIFEHSSMVDKARHSQPHMIDSKELVLKFPYGVNDKRIFHHNNETKKKPFSASKVRTGTKKDIQEILMKPPLFKPKKLNLKDFDGAGVNIFKD